MKRDTQRCIEIVLSAKMWIFAEIENVDLPFQRPDTAILGANTLDEWEAASLRWLDAEQQMRERVNALVSARVVSSRSARIPPDLHYWYWIRLWSAQKLTKMIVPSDHSRTVFRVPATMTKPRMLNWLLISWWSDGGIAEWTFTWQDVSDEINKRLS